MKPTDFESIVYDPTPEAMALLEQHDPIVVVKGLLNQLGACRQTKEIEKERKTDHVKSLEEYLELAEAAKQILRDKGYGWTGLDILETCKLVPQNPENEEA